MLRPGVLFLVGLTGSLFAAAAAGCHGSDSMPQCGDFAACGGSAGTGGGDAGSDAAKTFLCKGSMCTIGEEVCDVVTTIDATGQHVSGSCDPLPVPCQSPGADCSCFGDLMGCTCQAQPSGEFDVFCGP